MNLAHYSKAIVAVIWAAILVWNALRPGSAISASEAEVQQWVTMASAVLGPILVYAIPNRS